MQGAVLAADLAPNRFLPPAEGGPLLAYLAGLTGGIPGRYKVGFEAPPPYPPPASLFLPASVGRIGSTPNLGSAPVLFSLLEIPLANTREACRGAANLG